MKTITLSCPFLKSFRTLQVAGQFDLKEQIEHTIEYEPPPGLDEDWSIGCIVGASGSGKSVIAKEVYGDFFVPVWDNDKAVVDGFDEKHTVKEITSMFQSVGFASTPNWVKPYSVLSNGEQFRCDLARTLIQGGLVVFDEYTSVVDRNVAKVASAALAKGIKTGKIPCRFVAVTCHYDILDWLEPDWVLDTATGTVSRRLLRPGPGWQRPSIELKIFRCDRAAWRLFGKYHYLDHKIQNNATCYAGFIDDVPVCFAGIVHANGKAYRISRLVVLPDYQGIGIAGRFMNSVAGIYTRQGLRIRIGSAHPSMVAMLARSNEWKRVCIKRPPRVPQQRHEVGDYRTIFNYEHIG
jgi:GNAT superfamily N-acetyltransferase